MPKILLKAGWQKFILPEKMKMDQIKEIVEAFSIDSTVGGYYKSVSKSDITLEVIKDDTLINFVIDNKENPYQPILDLIEERFQKLKDHKTIVFRASNYYVDSVKKEYLNLENPDADPEEIIDNLIKECKIA